MGRGFEGGAERERVQEGNNTKRGGHQGGWTTRGEMWIRGWGVGSRGTKEVCRLVVYLLLRTDLMAGLKGSP